MKQKTYNQVTCLIFLAIAVLHGLRLLFWWNANIGGWEIPVWVSFFGLAAGAFLGWSAYKLEK